MERFNYRLRHNPLSTTTLTAIETAIEDVYEINRDELKVRTRLRKIVDARQTLFFAAWCATNLSLESLARKYGVHYTTVHHSVDKVQELYWSDKPTRTRLNKVAEMIGNQYMNNVLKSIAV